MTRTVSKPKTANITACASELRANKKGQGFVPLAFCFACLARQVIFTEPFRISTSDTTATAKSTTTPTRS
jgi:hypothetical protein